MTETVPPIADEPLALADPLLTPPATPAPPAPSLRRDTVRGLAWMAGQTMAVKVFSVGSQLLLAWLLTQEDFGLLGMVSPLFAIASILQQIGLSQILIARQARFDRWRHAATWLSTTMGVGGFVFAAAAAPVVARLYHQPGLVPLILVMGLGLPVGSVITVPLAKMQIDLRFGAIAGIGLLNTVLSTAATLLLAWRGWGPYSIAVGQIVAGLLNAAFYWSLAGVPAPRRLHFRRWRFLYGDSWWLVGSGVLTSLVQQGDYLVLGLTQTPAVVGVYYFAYNLSTQAMQLITVNLANVLLPVLSRFRSDDPKQTARFLEATELLAYVGVPLCVAQALLAQPLVAFFYAHRWDAAVLPLQLLSVAMIPAVVGGHSATLLKAQGRFRSCLSFAAVSAIIFLTCVATAAHLGAAASVAAGVIVAYSVIAVVGMLWAVLPSRIPARRVLTLFAYPGALAVGTGGVALFVATRVARDPRYAAGGYVAAVVVVFPLLYLVCIRAFQYRVWSAFVRRPFLR